MDSNGPVARRSAPLLIIGSILLLLEIDLTLGIIPLDILFQVIGGLLVILGSSRTLPRKPDPGAWTRFWMVILVVGAVCLRFVERLAMLTAIPPVVGDIADALNTAALAGALLVLMRGMKIRTRGVGRPDVHGAWHRAFFLSAVSFGVVLLVWAISSLLLWTFAGSESALLDLVYLLLGILSSLGTALPPLLLLHCLAVSTRADAHEKGVQAPWPAGFVLHRAGITILAVLFLIPLWLILLMYIHVTTTQDFNAYASENTGAFEFPPLPQGVSLIETGVGGRWERGEVVSADRTNEAGLEAASICYLPGMTLEHGEELLLDGLFEILATVRAEDGELAGFRAQLKELAVDSRFRLLCRILIDLDEPVDRKVSADGTWEGSHWKFPFRLDAALVSGAGSNEVQVLRVKGLGNAVHPDLEGKPALLTPRTIVFTGMSSPEINLDGALKNVLSPVSGVLQAFLDLITGDLPPDGEGLQYWWTVTGEPILGVFASGGYSHGFQATAWFESNSREYSYSMQFEDAALSGWKGSSSKTTRKVSTDLTKTWNERTW